MEAATYNIHIKLIERCRAGDRGAEYEIYKLYSKAMFNTAIRICGDRQEAEDVLQESFLSAFRNIQSYRGESAFGAWLKRIVVNKSLSALRKKKNDMIMMEEVPDITYVEERARESHLSVDLIKDAIKDLPAGFRAVLTLYLFEGYDHKEISEILNISESTSKTQYKRAKDKLKVLLEKEVRYG